MLDVFLTRIFFLLLVGSVRYSHAPPSPPEPSLRHPSSEANARLTLRRWLMMDRCVGRRLRRKVNSGENRSAEIAAASWSRTRNVFCRRRPFYCEAEGGHVWFRAKCKLYDMHSKECVCVCVFCLRMGCYHAQTAGGHWLDRSIPVAILSVGQQVHTCVLEFLYVCLCVCVKEDLCTVILQPLHHHVSVCLSVQNWGYHPSEKKKEKRKCSKPLDVLSMFVFKTRN